MTIEAVLKPERIPELVRNRRLVKALVRGADTGANALVVELHTMDGQFVMGRSTSGPRIFTTVDGAISALQEYGIFDVGVDSRTWLSRARQVSHSRGHSPRGKAAVVHQQQAGPSSGVGAPARA